MALDVGLGVLTAQVPRHSSRTVAEEYQDILAVAQVADSVGFDSIWVAEHHGASDCWLPSVTVMLGALAAVTSRVSLGTAVALAPFQSPLRFAEDCAVVDQLSGGRLILGLGAGWRPEEFDAFGVPIAERVGRTVELIKICRAAWTQQTFSFTGKYHRLRDVAVTPKPAHHVPVLLGGSAPGAVARAGRIADGFLATPFNSVDVFRAQVAMFDEAARAAGRDPERLDVGFHTNVWITPDGRIDESVRLPLSWACQATYEPASQHDQPADDPTIRELTIIGDPAGVLQQARRWIAGFERRRLHAIFRLHYPGMRREQAIEAIQAFARDVIPALRAGGS